MNKLLRLISLLLVFSCSMNSKNKIDVDPLHVLLEEAKEFRKKGYIAATGTCVDKISRKDRVIDCAKMNAISKISESLEVYVEHNFRKYFLDEQNMIIEELRKQITLKSNNCLEQIEFPSINYYQTPENIKDGNLTCGVLIIMPRPKIESAIESYFK